MRRQQRPQADQRTTLAIVFAAASLLLLELALTPLDELLASV